MPEIKLTDLVKKGTAVPGAGGGDFLTQLNSAFTNLQKTLKMAQDFKNMANPQPAGGQDVPPRQPPRVIMAAPAAPAPHPKGVDLEKILDTLIAMGNGDKTVGDVFEMLKPVTLKQAKEALKNAK
jgi:DNA topoisomerase VI subunit B